MIFGTKKLHFCKMCSNNMCFDNVQNNETSEQRMLSLILCLLCIFFLVSALLTVPNQILKILQT